MPPAANPWEDLQKHRKARLDWELAGAPPASRSRVSICQPWHGWRRSGGLSEDLGWVFEYWVRPSSKGFQLQYESWALGRKMHHCSRDVVSRPAVWQCNGLPVSPIFQWVSEVTFAGPNVSTKLINFGNTSNFNMFSIFFNEVFLLNIPSLEPIWSPFHWPILTLPTPFSWGPSLLTSDARVSDSKTDKAWVSSGLQHAAFRPLEKWQVLVERVESNSSGGYNSDSNSDYNSG